jgi:DNA damage-inducible protein 1
MKLTVASHDDRVFAVQLDDSETLSTLQAILEAESGIPAAQQQLVHAGRPLPASAQGQTLASLGLTNEDVLMLMPPAAAAGGGGGGGGGRGGGTRQRQQQQQNPQLALEADGSAKAPAAFIQAIKAQPELLAQLAASNPPLAAAVRNDDVAALQVCLWLLPGVVGDAVCPVGVVRRAALPQSGQRPSRLNPASSPAPPRRHAVRAARDARAA